MNCKNCGSPLLENDQFCKNCGAPVNAQNELNNVQQPMNNSMNQQPMSQPIQQSIAQQPMNQPIQQSQQNYNQPAWVNGYNSNPNYQTPKSNGNLKYVIIGVAIVVAIFAVVIVIAMFNNNNDNNSNIDNNINNNIDNNTNNGYNGESENSGITNTSNKNYKVKYQGFTFSIPDDLVYEETDDGLYVGDEENTWGALLEIIPGSYAQLKSKKSQLASLCQQLGSTCSATTEKNFEGVEFITMEMAYGGENAIIAFARVNSMYFIGITAYNKDNEIDYKILEKITPIIASVEQASVSNSIAPNKLFDFSGVADLAK